MTSASEAFTDFTSGSTEDAPDELIWFVTGADVGCELRKDGLFDRFELGATTGTISSGTCRLRIDD